MEISELKKLAQAVVQELKKGSKFWEGVLQLITGFENATAVSDMVVYNRNIGEVKKELNNNVQMPLSSDYNIEWKFEQKARYFALQTGRAFAYNDLKDFIMQYEGQERALQTMTGQLSTKLKACLQKKELIAAKFGSNHYTYYVLYDWLTEDRLDIKPEHYPSEEGFRNLAPEKRNKNSIQWLTK